VGDASASQAVPSGDHVNARKVLAYFLFFLLAADGDTAYASKHYFAPLGYVSELWVLPIPYKIGVANHIVLAILFFGRSRSRAEWVKPVISALRLCVAAIVTEFLWGMARGGDFKSAWWQVYYIWSGLLFGYCVAAVCAEARDFPLLLDAILYAAGYRAVMCTLYWYFYVHSGEWKTDFIMCHDDSVLQPAAVFIVIIRLLHGSRRRFASTMYLLLQVAAIFFNNRRLVWLSLASAAVFLFLLLPPSKPKKRMLRVFVIVAPILAIYFMVGQGRNEAIFKPVASFSSTTGQEDPSTKARNVENLGLVETGLRNNRLLGPGWGHPYVEVANWYTIAHLFPLWQYIPHNSILGLLAYTGILGFAGVWLIFPTAMFFNIRMARLGDTLLLRQLGMIGAIELIVVGYQMYGDMGTYYVRPMYLLGLSYAIAMRLPIEAGTWPRARAPKLESARDAGEAGQAGSQPRRSTPEAVRVG
jgi:hypothetical protein